MTELVEQMGKEHNLSLKTAYNSARGFYIQLYTGGKDGGPTAASLPPDCVKVTKVRNMLSFTTRDMIRLNGG